jgi:CheY-like chemotaxis protein
MKMPGMNGLEVAGRIKERQPWIPVVIITGYGTAASEAQAASAGVSGFLHKPLSPETIERSTRAALRVIEGGARKAQLEPVVAQPAPVEAAAEARTAAPGEAPARNRAVTLLKSTGLFLAAPFIGLAFIVALPFAMLGVIVWMAARPFAKRLRGIVPFLKNVGLFFAAPFVGLAYAIAFPFIGAGLLLWHAVRTRSKRAGRE